MVTRGANALGSNGPTQTSEVTRVARECRESRAFQGALESLNQGDSLTLAQQVALTEIPAPPFAEEARGARFAEMLADAGAAEVSTDEEGNVVGRLHGNRTDPPVVVAAHLDTVFPEGTDTRIRRDGDVWVGPGISDDGRGLAAVLALTRCLQALELELDHPLLLVGTVGEEGLGDLRGVRHLFSAEGAARDAAAFISLDGAGHSRIVTRGVGSRRYRITVNGEGGHSWVDWGTPNPINALSRAIYRLEELPLPSDTTLSVGRIEGGISINAIPAQAWMELEVRSYREAVLADLDVRVEDIVVQAVGVTSGRRRDGSPPLAVDVSSIGNRPAGATPDHSPLVMAARTATEALFDGAELAASSTDSNVPMALGVPAVTLGAGGEAALAHTTEEWYRNTRGPEGIARALLTLLVFDRLRRPQTP